MYAVSVRLESHADADLRAPRVGAVREALALIAIAEPEEGVSTPSATRYASVFTNVLYCVLKTLKASRFR